MQCLTVISLLVTLWVTIDARSFKSGLDGRIIGGEPVEIEEVPYQVSLQKNGKHFCGGSIIANNIIITAAHCLMEIPNLTELTILAGSSTRGEGGIVKTVKQIIRHEGFPTPEDNEYDIALLILTSSLKFSTKIRNIVLPDASDIIPVNTSVTITGWGRMSNGMIPRQLQQVNLPVIDQNKCKETYIDYMNVSEAMVCAGDMNIGGKDACDGDSGGPMAADNKLHGIISWGRGCGSPSSPGVGTRITFYRKWITSKVGL